MNEIELGDLIEKGRVYTEYNDLPNLTETILDNRDKQGIFLETKSWGDVKMLEKFVNQIQSFLKFDSLLFSLSSSHITLPFPFFTILKFFPHFLLNLFINY